ncbi:MAG: hypothetical protein U0871_00910 [Gemmataceae bacterium]
MSDRPKPSYECRHQLAEWVRLCCPCATEDAELLRGLLLIVERELVRACRHRTAAGDADRPAGRAGGAP